MTHQRDFLDLAVRLNVLRFGEFTLKSGRLSPYFFNAGLINSGAALAALGRAYAQTLLDSGVQFDLLYGPAYKGIALASATAIALAEHGFDVPFAFNRKEAKNHGEGGVLIGAPLRGRVVIVDDVISAGTSVRESVAMITVHGAQPAGVLIALDRQERGAGALSAADEVRQQFGMPVLAIANLTELLDFVAGKPELLEFLPQLRAYRAQFGSSATAVAFAG